jgi:hypothetical protein
MTEDLAAEEYPGQDAEERLLMMWFDCQCLECVNPDSFYEAQVERQKDQSPA